MVKYSLIWFFLINVLFGLSDETPKVLIYINKSDKALSSKAIEIILSLGKRNNIQIDTTTNAKYFEEDSLKDYHAVVFLSYPSELSFRQKIEFQRYIQAGGGFAGIHAIQKKNINWTWYDKLVGAILPNNSIVQQITAQVKVSHFDHELTKGINKGWKQQIHEHIEFLDKNITTLTETKVHQPVSWTQSFDGGSSFFLDLSLKDKALDNEQLQKHLLNAITFSLHRKPDFNRSTTLKVPEENRFNKAILAGDLDEPMMMDIAPDQSIYIIERKGTLKRYNPVTQSIKTIAAFNVFSLLEDGLLGIALDPDYAKNNYAYFYYSPAGNTPKQHVSRFKLIGDSLINSSEKILLEIPVQRESCCHSAGSLEFGPDGNLWISVGDNTSSKESSGYSPIDERPGRAPFDAQKSSANTQDLRGKILRIKPTEAGKYTIPAGNMFTDPTKGRPEIYVMGCRNPFRFAVDSKTGYLYWGDVGPDSGRDSTLGPRSYDEFNQAKQPGYYGWPYFVADNKAYPDFDFATNVIGKTMSPEAPVNNSPNNTGSKVLPPAQKPMIWYPYNVSDEFPYLGVGSRSAEAGPVYHFDQYKNSSGKFPKYYDGKLFIYDWARGWINVVSFNEKNDFKGIEPFLPNVFHSKPIDMMFGPDGAMYLLEYGQNYFAKNEEARLARIDYSENNRPPVARISVDQSEGGIPFKVNFSSKGSTDYDKNDQIKFEWSFTDINKIESREPNPSFIYHKPGLYKAFLKVTDNNGASSIAQVEIKVGNNKPRVSLNIIGNSTFYWDNHPLKYEAMVSDKEDGSIGNGIAPEAVSLNIDFLPQGRDLALVTGHQYNTTISKFEKGRLLVEGSDCKGCHAMSKQSVGPSLMAIGARYNKNPNFDLLTSKILKGGNGNWGDRLMSAHPQHISEEAGEMVKYILSLADVEEKAPLKGQFTPKEHIGKGDEGIYVFSLSYTDKGANGITSLNTKQINFLRNPKLEADHCEVFHNLNIMRPNAGALAFVRGFGEDAYFGYKSIDMTDIKKLTFKARGRGKLEISIDAPNGNIIGTIDFNSTDLKNWVESSTTLLPTTGLHDVYFNFKGLGTPDRAFVDWVYFGI